MVSVFWKPHFGQVMRDCSTRLGIAEARLFRKKRQAANAASPAPTAMKTTPNGSTFEENAAAPTVLPKTAAAKNGSQQQLVPSKKASAEPSTGRPIFRFIAWSFNAQKGVLNAGFAKNSSSVNVFKNATRSALSCADSPSPPGCRLYCIKNSTVAEFFTPAL